MKFLNPTKKYDSSHIIDFYTIILNRNESFDYFKIECG